MPGPGHAWISREERQAMLEVIESGHLFRCGHPDDPAFKRKVYTFEQELAGLCGTRHALATTSGSASLITSLLALGVGPGTR